MRFLRLASLMAAALLGVGGDAAIADETYGRNKYQLCKSPEPGELIADVTTFTAFSRDGGRVAIADGDRTVHICETAGKEIASLAVPSSLGQDDDNVHFAAFSPDGTRLVTASRDKMVRLWDIAGGRELVALEHPSPVYFATFSPDGTRLVTSSSDTTVRLWDVASGREIAVLDHPSPGASAVFSPDGARLATAGADGAVHVWDVAGSRETAVLRGHTKEVRDVRFSAGGAYIVTASADGTARIWDAASGLGLVVLRHPSPVSSAAFSADGKRIVTGAGNDAHVFDAALGGEIAVLKGHESDVNDAHFSPDGARIVTASDDRSVRVWDAGSGGQIAVLTGHLVGVQSATFSLDGQRIFTMSGPEAIVWTKLAAASLPEGSAGLWFNDFGTPEEPLPPEIARVMCVTNPIKISGDGLIVFFEAVSDTDPPQSVLHMRCAADLTCQIFAGAPDQGVESQGTGNLTVSGDTGNLCLAGECRPIARCPALEWTDEERKSGLAEKWEAALGQELLR